MTGCIISASETTNAYAIKKGSAKQYPHIPAQDPFTVWYSESEKDEDNQISLLVILIGS